jgi:hypothetical protein
VPRPAVRLKTSRRHTLLISTIALGIAVFTVAVYFMITGEYALKASSQRTVEKI